MALILQDISQAKRYRENAGKNNESGKKALWAHLPLW